MSPPCKSLATHFESRVDFDFQSSQLINYHPDTTLPHPIARSTPMPSLPTWVPTPWTPSRS